MEYRSKSNILRGQFSLYVLFSCNQRQRSYTNLGQPALSRKSTSTANIISIVRSNTHNLQMFTSRATDEGSLPEIVQYGPYYLPLNDLTASKGSNLYILLTSLGSTHQLSIVLSVGTSILKNRGWPLTVSRAKYAKIQCLLKF